MIHRLTFLQTILNLQKDRSIRQKKSRFHWTYRCLRHLKDAGVKTWTKVWRKEGLYHDNLDELMTPSVLSSAGISEDITYWLELLYKAGQLLMKNLCFLK